MKILENLVKVFGVLNFCFTCSSSEPTNKAIKYELVRNSPPCYTCYEKNVLTQETVASKTNTFSVEILSDFPVLKKGMLQISERTYCFWMNYHGLESVKPGVFDNQNIVSDIRLIGNKLTVISTGTFKNMEITKIDLSRNKITHLEPNAISDLPNLYELNLSVNQIAQFDGKGLVNTPKMWDINLAGNKLTKLGERSFTFMKKGVPVIVGLWGNEIEDIHPNTFKGIKVFRLSLGHNKLKRIPEQIFSENDIKYFSLDDNQVERLPAAFFSLKNLLDVSLKNNPLRCDVQEKLKKLSARTIVFDSQNC